MKRSASAGAKSRLATPLLAASVTALLAGLIVPATAAESSVLAMLAAPQIVALTATDIIADPSRDLIYASVPATAGEPHGNSVAALDPRTGEVIRSVFVGSDPWTLAISDDASTLYVALTGAAAVRRVDLTTFTAGLQFSLGNDEWSGPMFAEDIVVLPGQPSSIAVSLMNRGFSPRHEGVRIYDNGIARPAATQGHTGSNRIEPGRVAGRLYGYNNETTEFGFRRLLVDDGGIREVDVTENLVRGFGTDIVFHHDRVYATSGRVVDPEARVLLGQYSAGGPVAPDATLNRTFFASPDGSNDGVTISEFVLDRYTLVQQQHVPDVIGWPIDLVRWGERGLAFLTDEGQLVTLSDVTSATSSPAPSPSPTSSPSPSPSPSTTPSPTTSPSPSPSTSPSASPDPSPDASPSPAPGQPNAACPEGEVPEDGFRDVPESNAHESTIDCAVWWDLTSGSAPGEYAPGQLLTRAQMASFLARTIEATGTFLDPDAPDRFADDDGNVHELAINQLAQLGVVAGRDGGSYAPNMFVSRAQMATFLAEAYAAASGTPLPEATRDHFDDDAGHVHEHNINRVAEAGMVAGRGPRTFSPNLAVRRDQMASFLVGMLDVLVQQGHAQPPS